MHLGKQGLDWTICYLCNRPGQVNLINLGYGDLDNYNLNSVQMDIGKITPVTTFCEL